MTPEQIQQWAREAGLGRETPDDYGIAVWSATSKSLQAFAKLIRNATLEEAAVKCDELYYKNIGAAYGEVRYGIASCAKEIRSRKT